MRAFRFSGFTLDVENACLVRDGSRLTLSPKDFALLHHLVAHRGRVVSHAELLRSAAAKGWRQIGFVRGEPAIGKTTLIDEFALRAAQALVSETYAWFTEGFDSPDLKQARTFLEASP